MEIKVRKGIQQDIPAVLKLIIELATYENASNEVTNNLEDLERDGFGTHPFFRFFISETQGEVAGMALYYIKYSTWKGKCVFLEDLIVSEKFRGKKIGEKLFEAVIRVSKELKVKRMEWQVLNWNEPAINFYKKFNAELDGECINGKLVYDQIQKF